MFYQFGGILQCFLSFFHLPRTCRFKTRPNPPSKIARNAGGGQTQKQARLPLFFFLIILIITILPFNGNSMTSGEGSCITHCYGMEDKEKR